MAANHFIPSGRTSTVKRGEIILQVQTEYAYRPLPRITTTVLNNGRVLHKIERPLDREVESAEEQTKTEVIIKHQHSEVITILQGDSALPAVHAEETPEIPKPEERLPRDLTVEEKLKKIPGVTHIYTLDNEGNFFTDNSSEQFQRMFSPIFRNIRELIQLFNREAGVGITREQGVVEIEQDRLYFASGGTECYFIVVKRIDMTTNFEREIKLAVAPPVI